MPLAAAEIEAKLVLNGTAYWNILNAKDVLGFPVLWRDYERQHNRYFDSSTCDISSAGAVLRSREIEGVSGCCWTFKTGKLVGAVSHAAEINQHLPTKGDDIRAAFDSIPVATARELADKDLVQIAETLVDRTIFRLDISGAGPVDLCLDRIRIPGDPVFVEYELELEDQGAGLAAINDLAIRLADYLGATSSPARKLFRVQNYCDGTYGPKVMMSDDALAAVERWVADALVSNPAQILVISFWGGSCCGKTYLTSMLAERIGRFEKTIPAVDGLPSGVQIVHLDDWFGSLPYPGPISETNHFDLPEAIDMDAACDAVHALARGEPAEKPIYSFKEDRRVGTEMILPSRVVLVEGIWANDPRIPAALKVYLAASGHGQLIRRLLRDITRSSRSATKILHYFCRYTAPSHQRYREDSWKSADIVILNDYDPGRESHQMPALEGQLKARTTLTAADLVAAGAKVVADTTEHEDLYFAPDDHLSMMGQDVVLVRRDGGQYWFGYKSPCTNVPFGMRPCWGIPAEATIEKELLALGYRCVGQIRKKRTIFRWRGYTLHLDDVITTEGHRQRYLELVASDPEHYKGLADAAQALDRTAHWENNRYVELILDGKI